MGYLDQSQEQQQEIFNNMNEIMDQQFNKIGHTIRTALLKAQAESRVIVGLTAAIKMLSTIPDGSLICLMAVPQIDDSATHMHEVLLEAFCYENDIYVIKVDSAKKLSQILGKNTLETCCLIQKSFSQNGQEFLDNITKSENILVDHCEEYWNCSKQPIITLPAI